jgi:hypothetical protein
MASKKVQLPRCAAPFNIAALLLIRLTPPDLRGLNVKLFTWPSEFGVLTSSPIVTNKIGL